LIIYHIPHLTIMTPIRTSHCNFTFTAPAGISPDQCGDLHCMRNPDEQTITSFWKPEPEEANAIAQGGLVMLTIHGHGHPMVAMGAYQEPKNTASKRYDDLLQADPPLLDQEELFQSLGKLIERIEACGGSTALTHAVMLAADIRHAIGNQWNPANEYAAQRVREIIQPADS
jgi:hypothetical protein